MGLPGVETEMAEIPPVFEDALFDRLVTMSSYVFVYPCLHDR